MIALFVGPWWMKCPAAVAEAFVAAKVLVAARARRAMPRILSFIVCSLSAGQQVKATGFIGLFLADLIHPENRFPRKAPCDGFAHASFRTRAIRASRGLAAGALLPAAARPYQRPQAPPLPVLGPQRHGGTVAPGAEVGRVDDQALLGALHAQDDPGQGGVGGLGEGGADAAPDRVDA